MDRTSNPLRILLFLGLLLFSGCRSLQQTSIEERARTLTGRAIIVDGHVDVPYRLSEYPEDISRRTVNGDFDYVRAKEGGLDAPFISIYIPIEVQGTGREMILADSLIDLVEGILKAHPDKFAPARKPDDIVRNSARGQISFPMGLENGAPIGEDFERLHHLWDRGIRYVTLTHGADNQIGDSSYDSTHTWNGLSPFGMKLIPEMNRMGMIVDVSHVTDSTLQQVARLSRAPIIASHSSARAFTPGWERNADDEGIRAIARTGGIVMVTFGSIFLRESYREQSRAMAEEERGSHPLGTVEDVVDHIDHIVRLVGIDHVGLGSDFDGVSSLPEGLQDVSGYPNLVAALLRRGYSETEIEKILGQNFLRVWREVLAFRE